MPVNQSRQDTAVKEKLRRLARKSNKKQTLQKKKEDDDFAHSFSYKPQIPTLSVARKSNLNLQNLDHIHDCADNVRGYKDNAYQWFSIESLNSIRDWISILKKSLFKWPRTLNHIFEAFQPVFPIFTDIIDALLLFYLVGPFKIFSQTVSSTYDIWYMLHTGKVTNTGRLAWKLYLQVLYAASTILMVAIPVYSQLFAYISLSHSLFESSYDIHEKSKNLLLQIRQLGRLKANYFRQLKQDHLNERQLKRLAEKINTLDHEIRKAHQDFMNRFQKIAITVATILLVTAVIFTSFYLPPLFMIPVTLVFSGLVFYKFLHNLWEHRQKEPEFREIIKVADDIASHIDKSSVNTMELAVSKKIALKELKVVKPISDAQTPETIIPTQAPLKTENALTNSNFWNKTQALPSQASNKNSFWNHANKNNEPANRNLDSGVVDEVVPTLSN